MDALGNMAQDMQVKTSTEYLELIEVEMKELRQMEALEAQIREMAAGKRERVMGLWKKALGGQAIGMPSVTEAAPAKPEANEVSTAGGGLANGKTPVRPYGSPGAPRDLLAEAGTASGTAAKIPQGNGASALVNGDALKRAPSAQQVFQSLNRLVGGSKNEPLKN
jgi:hypothetical protein